MAGLHIDLLRHALIIVLCGSYLVGSTFFTLMFIPPFALFGWVFLPIVVCSIIVGAYSIAWIVYLYKGQTDRSFNLPYNPKRIFKINYATFSFLWTSIIMFVPLFAEYGYYKFFVLGKRIRRIIKEDIYYGSNSNSNRLDVYIPDTSKYPQIFDAAFHPVIVFIHGGSWGSGDKIWYSLLALRLRQMGYVVVVPNVTLYPKAKVDVMLSDIKRTLVWTKRFISKFGGDPNKIYIMGHSSGAHLASLVTVRDSIIKSQTMEGRVSSNLSDIDPELELPKIAGLILMAGIYDIGRHYLWETKRGVEEISPMGRVMGDSPESFEMNSPTLLLQSAMKDREVDINKLKKLIPQKILLIHGDMDETVPLETTLRFNLVLSELNIDDLRLRIMNGMEHSDPVVGMMYSPFRNRFTPHLISELGNFMLQDDHEIEEY
ncbi:Alpha/Beta hydrolase protein [Gigaspora rosea]|uniref:Alpha/Beta hydrolase protein n=1 Tax=Gigaspora rosea TaxID=44941 RepID=A0A397U3E4_9GLOM|nr:Alpha/Beta hydrolase protein [Gigaspora rosea]